MLRGFDVYIILNICFPVKRIKNTKLPKIEQTQISLIKFPLLLPPPPLSHNSPLYCSCEAAVLQAACPDIQQQLSVDLSFFHSSTAMLSPPSPSPCPAQAPFGSAAWLWRRGCPLGPKLGLSLQQWTGLRSRPFGLRQEQPSPVHN